MLTQVTNFDIARVNVINLDVTSEFNIHMVFILINADGEQVRLNWSGRMMNTLMEKALMKPRQEISIFPDNFDFKELMRVKDGYVQEKNGVTFKQKYKLNLNGDEMKEDEDSNYVFLIATVEADLDENNKHNTEFGDLVFRFPKDETTIYENKYRIKFDEKDKKKVQEAIIREILN